MKHFPLLFAPVLAIAACAIPTSEFVARLGDQPALGGGSFSTGGGLTVAVDAREKDGKTLICGVWAQSRQQSILTKTAAARVLPTGVIYIGNDRALQNLLFMQEVEPAADYSGKEANCRLTDRPWTGQARAQNIKVRIPRQTLLRKSDDLGGSIKVTFKQTGPGAGE